MIWGLITLIISIVVNNSSIELVISPLITPWIAEIVQDRWFRNRKEHMVSINLYSSRKFDIFEGKDKSYLFSLTIACYPEEIRTKHRQNNFSKFKLVVAVFAMFDCFLLKVFALFNPSWSP